MKGHSKSLPEESPNPNRVQAEFLQIAVVDSRLRIVGQFRQQPFGPFGQRAVGFARVTAFASPKTRRLGCVDTRKEIDVFRQRSSSRARRSAKNPRGSDRYEKHAVEPGIPAIESSPHLSSARHRRRLHQITATKDIPPLPTRPPISGRQTRNFSLPPARSPSRLRVRPCW